MGGSRGNIFIDQYWLNSDTSCKEIYIFEGGMTPYLTLASNIDKDHYELSVRTQCGEGSLKAPLEENKEISNREWGGYRIKKFPLPVSGSSPLQYLFLSAEH